MRIFYSSDSVPMILDSVSGLNEAHKKLMAFLVSNHKSIILKADTSGNPEPYDEFLPYIKFEINEKPIFASFAHDKGIIIQGSTENLKVYISNFEFEENEDGSHHHPDNEIRDNYLQNGTLSLIIEADFYYIEEHQHKYRSYQLHSHRPLIPADFW